MPEIDDITNSPDFKIGLNTRKLKPGTKLEVTTKNSTYHIDILDYGGNVIVHGGKYAKTPTKARLTGSTWGGTQLRVGWIGPDMHMEFWFAHMPRPFVTTGVKNCKVMGQGWEYDMEWDA